MVGRFDGLGKIVDDEEKNAGIVVTTASRKHSGFDEVSGDFPSPRRDPNGTETGQIKSVWV
ncbi:hypothetical protein [Membranihabitans maritimus]|uniref:hypothetical protein n=1 Tax=Membranihabitans maritimus TaxID=2904244 RepID=UPI001F44C33F|nr:hypothetical protein [Membranihabitans maritimus]